MPSLGHQHFLELFFLCFTQFKNYRRAKKIDVALHYEDDFDVSGKLTAGLEGIKFSTRVCSKTSANGLKALWNLLSI